MPPLIAANWKMNPPSLAEAAALATAVTAGAGRAGGTILLCPPFTALATVAAILRASPVMLGAQDCSAAELGAHTGDISPAMLADLGVTHVILGHSERRGTHAETDAAVRAKATAARHAGLVPIICVGESADQRTAGRATVIVGAQLAGSLPADFAGIIAYEPIWAIGTGRTPTPDEVAAMHAFIAEQPGAAGRPVLYGGSVSRANAAALLSLPYVGGALVGGASLAAEGFLAIASAAPGSVPAMPG